MHLRFRLILCISLAACGGRTASSGVQDASSDARSADGAEHDARMNDAAQADRTSVPDAHADRTSVPDAELPDACVSLAHCCSFIPQVAQLSCYSAVAEGSSAVCGAEFGSAVENNFLDGGPCVGEGHGTAACVTLASCCAGDPSCDALIDAGNQDACASTWRLDESMSICPVCTGACN
jgi:hypothetical protein